VAGGKRERQTEKEREREREGKEGEGEGRRRERKRKGKEKFGWVYWLLPIIPTTWEVEIRKIVVRGQHGEKLRPPPSQSTRQLWWCASAIPATWEA
jgi:hypothetical protein